MSENRENREEQIQRLAENICRQGGRPLPPNGPCSECVNVASRSYNAGARIPDPPTPAAPEVVVTREADDAAMGAWRRDGFMASALRAAFPHLIAANPWAVDAEIRRRVATASRRSLLYINGVQVDANDALIALGVTP